MQPWHFVGQHQGPLTDIRMLSDAIAWSKDGTLHVGLSGGFVDPGAFGTIGIDLVTCQ